MREEYRKSSSEVNEITAHFLASRSRLLVVENQVNDWKDECRLIVHSFKPLLKEKLHPTRFPTNLYRDDEFKTTI